MTIALNNQQIYDDLKHLGANHNYLYQCIKSQIGKVFKTPVVVGTTLIYLLYFMIMYANDSGRLTAGELVGMRNCGILVIVMTIVIYAFYKVTLKNVCRILKIIG